ncbi:MAG TPA: DUF5916 domain-containing protein [Gemmatimonadaceae bacterium]|nr:DUF5916 domain-containing protein [Gemmatimonadaceae bacterium]
MRLLVSLPCLALLLLPSGPARAQTGVSPLQPAGSREVGLPPTARPATAATATTAMAVRAAEAPQLDGRADDAAWSNAPVIDQFLEYEPNPGAETRFRTEARVAYDARNLYVLVRMFDPAPDSIVSLLARRDERVPSEQLKLVIDSYHDRRTAYQFAVNPAGVKRDFYVYNDNIEDPSWDAVWDVATAVDSAGWVAEFRIPLSQLRYADRPEHTFGLMIVRDVARTGARISWPLFHRDRQGYVSQSGTIGGISGIASPRRIEVVPYVVTKNVTEARAQGFGHPQELAAGADVKVGLSSNLTLDATINPDFGQVEADPAQLNLTAFEQFFSERRPFFLEGTGIFNFDVQCGDIDSGCTGLFYSRRVGRAPQLRDLYGDAGSPLATTILGAMATAVNRRLDAGADPYLRSDAYTGGVDVRHRFWDRNYEVRAYLAGSYVRGSADAIARLQRDGVHRYQRPDDGLVYDPTRTSLTGDAQRISFSKFGGGITRFQTLYQRFSPGFEINDAGFLSRADEQLFRNWVAFQWTRPTAFYNRLNLNLNHWSYFSASGMQANYGHNVNTHVQLRNFMWLHLGGNANALLPSFNDRAARGGPAVRTSPNTNFWAGVEGDGRRALTPYLWFGAWRGDGGNSSNWYVEPEVSFRAASRLRGSLGASYEQVIDDRQWIGNFGDVGSDTTHYTFARLDQKTLGMTGRLTWTFTPELSLQAYVNPFWSAGTYSDWRELSDDPRARDYAARYRPYTAGGDPGGFRSLQFNSNAVLRWEYLPGSTIFLVWQQGRGDFEARAHQLAFRDDARDLFALHPDNTLLIKASYWFNP